jgi:hypothetical protein
MKQEQYIYINQYGDKRYYKDREMTIRHRLDGPAIEYADGHKVWCVDDKYLTEKQFNTLTSPTLELTLEDIAAKFDVDISKVKIKA